MVRLRRRPEDHIKGYRDYMISFGIKLIILYLCLLALIVLCVKGLG